MSRIKIETIIAVLRSTKSEITIKDFLDLHTLNETYFRRLLYISLRLNSESDKDAKKMTSLCKINSIEVIEKAINLISQKKLNNSGNKINFALMKTNYTVFSTYFNYFKNYTSRHRNLYLHGINNDIDEKTLKLLYCLEKHMLIEIEKILKLEYGKSCFDTPTIWGASRVTKPNSNTIPQRMQNYKLGDLGRSPIKNSSVRSGLKKLYLSCE